MKNHKNIRRIYEDESIEDFNTMLPATTEDPSQMDQELAMSAPAEPTEPAQNMIPQPAPQGSADPMSMTVAEFIEKCKEVDPLICMGIEAFIEKNKGAFGGNMLAMPPADQDMTFSAATANAESPEDMTFSSAIAKPMQPTMTSAPEPVKPFSLDQSPEVLNFPNQK